MTCSGTRATLSLGRGVAYIPGPPGARRELLEGAGEWHDSGPRLTPRPAGTVEA